MPAARGVKRTASKSSASTASSAPKNKKKRGAIQLEIPTAPKKKGCVFTCGQGDVGQLGLGGNVTETTKFKFVSALGNKIVDAKAGGMHTIALDSEGKVWTFGCNDEGALGRTTSSDTDEGTPKQVSLPLPAVSISAGDSHSAVLLENGDIYAWGAFRDSHGSMGLVVRGREGKPCKEPVKVDIGETAVAQASGGDHLVILSMSGSVYTMGCGEQGQLGRLSQRSASREARQGFNALLTPTKVILKGGASQIWAGYHATFVLDANKEKMFAWGLNNYGQLGIMGEKRKTAIYTPHECEAFANNSWQLVSAGQHHSLATDTQGVAYALGRCEYGRLGLGESSGDAEKLEPIPKLQNKKCISISAGTCNSFAVTDAGEVYAWGMGSEGQLGTGASADCSEPTAAVLQATGPALRVSAGGQHSVLLQEDPTAQKEASPAPEKETVEEKVEEKKEKRTNKRQKKQEQDEEISSTSSAQPAEVETKLEKLNGNEKKEIVEPVAAMDVDDNDKSQENKDEQMEETEPTDQTDQTNQTEQTEQTEQTDHTDNTDQTDQTDTDSQKSQDADDVEMKSVETAEPAKTETVTETEKPSEETEINGTVETNPVVLTTA